MSRDVVVVGGGLAGLTAAYRLQQTGRQVTVLERRPLMGGKARSFPPTGETARTPFQPWNPNADLSKLAPTVDKGYHIFPGWYHELWSLVDELDSGDRFYPRDRARRSERSGGYALFMPPLEDLSYDELNDLPGDRFSRVSNMKTLLPESRWKFWEYGPPLSMALTAIGLASASGRTVAEMTVPDFVSSRWYNGMERAALLQDLIVKALANPSKHTSAYTMRQTFRRWIPTIFSTNPWTPARGPLQHCLIEPLVEACRGIGVSMERDTLVSMRRTDDVLGGLTFESGTDIDTTKIDVVLALPADVLLSLVRESDDLVTIRSLSTLAHLHTAPMGSIDLYFVDPDSRPEYPDALRPENFTDRHFSLIDSEFALTGFAISNIPEWKPYLSGAPGLVIQFVSGNVLEIHEQPREQFAKLLITEIAAYLGFEPEHDLLACVAIPSSDEQLTMNDAGTWDKRPPADIKELCNLFLAGDFVKTSVDVAGMEAAVESGSNAARAILLHEAITDKNPRSRDDWDRLIGEVQREIPRPTGPPSKWWQNLIWPVLRAVFVVVHRSIGWLVVAARAPLHLGHDFVGELHDRYEDHRAEVRRDGLGWLRWSNWRRGMQRGVPAAESVRDRRRGAGEPMGGRDWILIFAGWLALLGGLVSAFVLATRVDGYVHLEDAMSVLGRESGTRSWYIAVSISGWVLLGFFAAVVRRFMPGSQVLVWMIAWFGFLWMVVGLFPLCAVAGCDGTGARWSNSVHVGASVTMALLLVVMPWFTSTQVLRRLPVGYDRNWAGFRKLSAAMAALTTATGVYFVLAIVDLAPLLGLAQRLHWIAGNTWLFLLGGWMFARRHRGNDGSVVQPVGPLRSVDQRSLWA